jgi:hypothetical protein
MGYRERLVHVLKDIVTIPVREDREAWRDERGGLYDAAIEYLLDQGGRSKGALQDEMFPHASRASFRLPFRTICLKIDRIVLIFAT